MTLYTIITSLHYSCAVSHNVQQGGNHTTSLRLQQTTKLHCMCHQTLAWTTFAISQKGSKCFQDSRILTNRIWIEIHVCMVQVNGHLRATCMKLRDTEQKSSKTSMHSFLWMLLSTKFSISIHGHLHNYDMLHYPHPVLTCYTDSSQCLHPWWSSLLHDHLHHLAHSKVHSCWRGRTVSHHGSPAWSHPPEVPVQCTTQCRGQECQYAD